MSSDDDVDTVLEHGTSGVSEGSLYAGTIILGLVCIALGFWSAFQGYKDERRHLFYLAAAEFGAFCHNQLMPFFLPGSGLSVASCWVLAIFGGIGAGVGALMLPRAATGICMGTLVASLLVLSCSGVMNFWVETILFIVLIVGGAVAAFQETELSGMAGTALFGGFLVAIGVDVFVPASALLLCVAQLFQIRLEDRNREEVVITRGYLVPVLFVWITVAMAGFVWQTYVTGKLGQCNVDGETIMSVLRFEWLRRRNGYDELPDDEVVPTLRTQPTPPPPAQVAFRNKEARVPMNLGANSYNLFRLDNLPESLVAYAAPVQEAASRFSIFFGFQPSSVKNQVEHLLILLGNHRRYENNRFGLSAVQVLHNKVFDNYRAWCGYLRIHPNFVIERSSNWERGHIDALVHDLMLHFCIWGEASNVRHMPEAICFIYHKCMEEFLVCMERRLPIEEKDAEFFLEQCVMPLYKVIKALSKSGRVEHKDKHNYDDMNEFFWSTSCLQYSYRLAGSDMFLRMENGALGGYEAPAPPVSTALGSASKSFVEHRSWLAQLLGLWRVFEYHVLWFQFLACIALGNFLYWRWDFFLQVLSSIFITINLMPYIEELLDASAAVARPLDGPTVSSALLRLGGRFVILVYQTMYFMWTFTGGNEVEEGAPLRQMGDATFWWWQYIWVSLPPLLVWFVGMVFQLYPPLLTAVLESNSEYVQAFLAMVYPLSREFTCKTVHTSFRDTVAYTMFWAAVLLVKLSFSYWFEVMALMKPSVDLYDDYMNYPSGPQHNFLLTSLRILAVWVPQFLIFLIDTNIWYAVISSITGVIVGFNENLGEVRDYRAIRKYFMLLAHAFAEKIIANGALKSTEPTYRDNSGYGAVDLTGTTRTRHRQRRRPPSGSQLGSASFSPKPIGYGARSASREDVLRAVSGEGLPLLPLAPADGKGSKYLPPSNARVLRSVTGAEVEKVPVSTKDVKSGLSEFLDARTQRWVVFASAWNDIMKHLRGSDLISNQEQALMTFDRFANFSKPVYLPVFVTAGALERALDIFTTQATNYRNAISLGKGRRDEAFNQGEEATRHVHAIREKLATEMVWAEAASEAWELASWLLVRLLGPAHEEDLIETVAFVECVTGVNPGAAGGKYSGLFALDCIKVEDLSSLMTPLQKLVGVVTKALKKRASKGPVAHRQRNAALANKSSKNMKKSMSVSNLDRMLSAVYSAGQESVALEPTAEEAEDVGAVDTEQNAQPQDGAPVFLEDRDRDAVREAARALLFKCRSLLREPDITVDSDMEEIAAGKRVARLRDSLTFLLKLENGFFWNDAYASVQLDSLTTDSQPSPLAVLNKLQHLISLTSAEAEPHSSEAKRRLSGFVNTLFMDLPKAPRIKDMMSWSVMTPYYSEDVAYNRSDLEAKNNENLTRGVSILLYLQKLYPREWANFLERTRAADDGQMVWSKSVIDETRRWASLRAQTLSRTVEGIMYYEAALKLLAELEGLKGTDVDEVVKQKFTYVVSCQVYGRMRREGSSKAEDIENLMHRFPNLRIAYIDNVRIGRDGEEAFYSVLVKSEEGKSVKECFRVRLPGNPVLGEGKPENQNHAIIFTRGEKLQAIDMNQDGYFEEGLKMRNLLQEFEKSDKYIPGSTSDQHLAILGFREHIFTGSVSALASYMAMQETAFVTLGQRVLNRPLRMRLHYGHPDLFDKIYMMTRGGVSKASKGINLSEDIFAGYNAVTRGGQVEFKEYCSVGKGRDVGLSQTYKFEAKLSQGNAEQSLSRDLYRMAHRLDFLRLLSFYWGGIGHYVCSMLTVFTLYTLVYIEALLALYSLEKIGFRRIMPIGVLQMVLAGMGLLQTAPLFATIVIERGFVAAIYRIFRLTISGAPLYFIFHIQTRAHYFVQTIMCGGAQYRPTGRGFEIKHTSFDDMYRFFASSHLYLGFDLVAGLSIFALTTGSEQCWGRSWALWLCAIAFLCTPIWFNPQVYEWDKALSDYQTWIRWQTGSSGGAAQNWTVWWQEEVAPFSRLRLSQRLLLCVRACVYILVAFGIIDRYAGGSSTPATELTTLSQQKGIVQIAILVLALIIGYVCVDLLRDSVSYGVRRGAKMLLSTAFVVSIGYLITLQSNYMSYAMALYFCFGGLSHLALLSNIAILRPFVRICNRIHDIVLAHAIFIPIFVLSILQIPSRLQTYLLFGDALSSGVVIDDILQKARTSQMARAKSNTDSDVIASIRRLEALVNKQQRVIQQLAAGEIDAGRAAMITNMSMSEGSDLSSLVNKQPETREPQGMTSVQSMVDIRSLAEGIATSNGDANTGVRAAVGEQESKGDEFTFHQPAQMPPRF